MCNETREVKWKKWLIGKTFHHAWGCNAMWWSCSATRGYLCALMPMCVMCLVISMSSDVHVRWRPYAVIPILGNVHDHVHDVNELFLVSDVHTLWCLRSITSVRCDAYAWCLPCAMTSMMSMPNNAHALWCLYSVMSAFGDAHAWWCPNPSTRGVESLVGQRRQTTLSAFTASIPFPSVSVI